MKTSWMQKDQVFIVSPLRQTAQLCWEDNRRGVDLLLIALIGLRRSVKQNLNVSSAEMLFGTSLLVPRRRKWQWSQNFPQQIGLHLKKIRPMASTHHRTPFVYKEWKSYLHIFVRIDSVRKSLDKLFTGPHGFRSHYSRLMTVPRR